MRTVGRLPGARGAPNNGRPQLLRLLLSHHPPAARGDAGADPCRGPSRGSRAASIPAASASAVRSTTIPTSGESSSSATFPTGVPTTGVPQASASSTTFGHPSWALASTERSAAPYQEASSWLLRGPAKTTRSAIFSRAASWRSSPAIAPSAPSPPTMAKRSVGQRFPSFAIASSTRWNPLRSESVPTETSSGPYFGSPRARRASVRSTGRKSSGSIPFSITRTFSAGMPRATASAFSDSETAITRAARRSAKRSCGRRSRKTASCGSVPRSVIVTGTRRTNPASTAARPSG